jgi:membrane protease YdiL (CAAX protease family)
MNLLEQSLPVAAPACDMNRETPRLRRVFACLLFVGIWMAFGPIIHGDSNMYLMLGIPLTILFQLYVARQPLQDLWLRSGARIALTGRLFAMAAVLIIWPAYSAIRMIQLHSPLPIVAWMVCCVAGALPAAYALQRFGGASVRALLICLATGGAAAIAILAAGVFAQHRHVPVHALVTAARWFFLYFPATFVIEEVSFRGALDSYIHRPGERRPWLSALFVSTLWGLWHLPITPHPTIATAIVLVIYQCVLGVPLSFAWRRSGNLAVPCAVHAVVDAVRNALFGLG